MVIMGLFTVVSADIGNIPADIRKTMLLQGIYRNYREYKHYGPFTRIIAIISNTGECS